MRKLYICFQIFFILTLTSVAEASYPIRNIADVVHAFELNLGRLEMSALEGARKAVENLEKSLADIRVQQETSSPERFWTTGEWQKQIQQKSNETVERLKTIDFLFSRDVNRLYRYYYNSLNALKAEKESEGDLEKIEMIDKVLQELKEHPRLTQAISVLDAYKTDENANSLNTKE